MLILEYHSVQPVSKCKFMVTVDELEESIKYFLSKNYEFINLLNDDLLPFSNNSVLITFDDGYGDNYKYLFPLVKKYNIPIVIYLVTNYIGKNMRLGGVELDMLTVDNIKEMSQSGLVYFGSHTHNHILLDEITKDNKVLHEIKKSKDTIFQLTGYRPRFFCYPKGRLNEKFDHILMKEFDYAVTTKLGCASVASNILKLPRIEMHHGESKLKKYIKLNCLEYMIKFIKKVMMWSPIK